jgi:hypothetical protein
MVLLEVITENSKYLFRLESRVVDEEKKLVAIGKRIGTKKSHIKVSPLSEVTYSGEFTQCKVGEKFILKGKEGIKTSKVLSMCIYEELENIREYFDLI